MPDTEELLMLLEEKADQIQRLTDENQQWQELAQKLKDVYKRQERDEYLEEELAQFPYVNGGLFADETIEIPPFTEEIKDLCSISPLDNLHSLLH